MLKSDSFSLLKNARKYGANERRYAIDKVGKLFQSPSVKESLRLRELYGYYGHGLREMIGSLDVPEVAVIKVNGNSIVTNTVPSNVCVALDIDEDTGVITHTEEVLDTDPGKIVQSMLKGEVGGWSWATSGKDGYFSIPTCIKGFDYVVQPNYISLLHPASEGMMNESAGGAGGRYSEQGVMFLESMRSAGYGQEAVDAIVEDMRNRAVDLDLIAHFREQTMILESVRELEALEFAKDRADLEKELDELRGLNERRTAMFLDSVERLPIFMSQEQRQALSRMANDSDFAVVRTLFESVRKLPNGRVPNIGQPERSPIIRPTVSNQDEQGMNLSFSAPQVPKFQ